MDYSTKCFELRDAVAWYVGSVQGLTTCLRNDYASAKTVADRLDVVTKEFWAKKDAIFATKAGEK
jgi:hypothetical protein